MRQCHMREYTRTHRTFFTLVHIMSKDFFLLLLFLFVCFCVFLLYCCFLLFPSFSLCFFFLLFLFLENSL